jgi:hypothetical protein
VTDIGAEQRVQEHRPSTMSPGEHAPDLAAVNDEAAADADLTQLMAEAQNDLEDVLAIIDWAEDEIQQACRRHPAQADVLFHAFTLLRPGEISPAFGTEFVFRSHARELLERIAAGSDPRPATTAELCMTCARISLQVPLHGAPAGLYFRLWLRAFPDHPVTPDQVDNQAHYETLYAEQMNDLESDLRRKVSDPARHLGDITCKGLHHGEATACRYTTRSTP